MLTPSVTAPGDPTLLTCARWLRHARGFPVFPVGPDKKPLVAWAEFQSSLPSDAQLLSWFGNGKGATGIGIATGTYSRLVVVDTDTEDAEQWAAAHLPATEMMCKTARGTHRYYQHPGGDTIRNGAKIKIADGVALDVRADGGFVVGPQSLHASGIRYERLGQWPPVDQLPVFDLTWITPETPPAKPNGSAPLLSEISSTAAYRARAYLRTVEPAIQGQGGDTATFRVACLLVNDFALDDGTAFALFRDWNAGCVPSWTDAELEEKLRNARKYGRHAFGQKLQSPAGPLDDLTPAAVDTPRTFPLTDSGNAEYFAARYGEDVRYDHRRQRWLTWSGHRWQPDANASVRHRAKLAMRQRLQDASRLDDSDARAKLAKWALSSESRGRLDALLYLAQAEAPIADTGDGWDAQPMLLGVPNGVVDLRTGALRPGRREDRITRQAAVRFDPAALCVRWEQFLTEIFNGDPALIAYVQKVVGYSLSGDTSEQILILGHGSGANGKGTLYNTITFVLGDYGCTMPFTTIEINQRSAIPNDLAALDGPRMATASETQDGTRLNESRIKALTGCDPISARFLHGEFFTFRPQCKFWLAVNHKPIVRDDSYGFWRRIRLLPFTQTFPVTPGLDATLKAEAAGVLAWAVRGCLLWQQDGLTPPAAVVDATQTYEQDSDIIGAFLEEATELDANAEVRAADLYAHYKSWADRHGLAERERFTATAFSRKIAERFARVRTRTGTVYQGLSRTPTVAGSDQ
jgi:putative DNA primase/helicase